MPNTVPAAATGLPINILSDFEHQPTSLLRDTMDRQCIELMRRVFAGPTLTNGEWVRLEAHLLMIKRRQRRAGSAVQS